MVPGTVSASRTDVSGGPAFPMATARFRRSPRTPARRSAVPSMARSSPASSDVQSGSRRASSSAALGCQQASPADGRHGVERADVLADVAAEDVRADARPLTGPGCRHGSRWSGTRGTGAHRARTARRRRRSDRLRRTAGRCRIDRRRPRPVRGPTLLASTPSRIHEPIPGLMTHVFLPIQPRPARQAYTFSCTGPSSTHQRASNPGPAASRIHRGEFAEAAPHHVVIVVAPGVARDARPRTGRPSRRDGDGPCCRGSRRPRRSGPTAASGGRRRARGRCG